MSREADISQGKTPQALKQMAMREGARDNFDRFMLEKTMEQVTDRFVDLIAKKQEKPIKLQLLAKELEEVSKIYPDAVQMFESNNMGEVIVDLLVAKVLAIRQHARPVGVVTQFEAHLAQSIG